MLGLNGRALPWLALATTVTLWAGYLVAVRAAAGTGLSPIDVGALRSVPAALVLLPLTLRRGIFPGGATWLDVALIGGVGGTLFTLLLSTGAQFAPVADSGIFAPSMLPVFVTLLAVVVLGAQFTSGQYTGLAVIVIGAVFVGGIDALSHSASGAWRGHLLFLAASFAWAIYTIRFRASGLGATDAALILVTWSGVIFLIAMVFTGTALTSTSSGVLVTQGLMGLSAGLIANFTYLYSVRQLGSAIAAASAALVPVLATLGGWVFLGEPIGFLKASGITIVAVGVVLASGVISRPQTV